VSLNNPGGLNQRPIGAPPDGVRLTLTIAFVWDFKNGQPHKCLERPAYFQIVPHLPWLRRIEASDL
jgi:hypothetical protein